MKITYFQRYHAKENVVIMNQKIIGHHRTFEEAYDETVNKEDLGTFLIQFCTRDQSALINSFCSNNVVFD